MNITKITLLKGRQSPDRLILFTDLPDGCYPYTGQATATMTIAKGGGESYARTHFATIPLKIVDV